MGEFEGDEEDGDPTRRKSPEVGPAGQKEQHRRRESPETVVGSEVAGRAVSTGRLKVVRTGAGLHGPDLCVDGPVQVDRREPGI